MEVTRGRDPIGGIRPTARELHYRIRCPPRDAWTPMVGAEASSLTPTPPITEPTPRAELRPNAPEQTPEAC